MEHLPFGIFREPFMPCCSGLYGLLCSDSFPACHSMAWVALNGIVQQVQLKLAKFTK